MDQIKTVLPDNLEDLQAVKGMDLATLITCTPYGVNTHRLLVRGSRTDYIPPEIEETDTAHLQFAGLDSELLYIGIALGLALLILLLILLWMRRRRKQKQEEKRHDKKE